MLIDLGDQNLNPIIINTKPAITPKIPPIIDILSSSIGELVNSEKFIDSPNEPQKNIVEVDIMTIPRRIIDFFIISSLSHFPISKLKLNSSYEKSKDMTWHEVWLVAGTFVGSSIVLAIGIFTIHYQRKENKRRSTIDVFEMLNNKTHKNAEQNLRNALKTNETLMINNEISEDFHDDADIVSRNYDQIGGLIKQGLVDPDEYYFMFGGITMKSFVVLKEWLDTSKNEHFRVYFRELAENCYYYFLRKCKTFPHPTESRNIQREDIF